MALSVHCPIDDEFEENLSSIKISYIADEDTWAILIKAPPKIDGLNLSRLMIGKGERGNILAIPLASRASDNMIEAHFYANELMLNGMRLHVSYGDSCPKTIAMPLKINKTLNQTPKSGAG